MPLSRSSHRKVRCLPLLVAAALLPASLALAVLEADNEPRSLVRGGDFEREAVSLRLPAVSPFPLVAGGWGARAVQARHVRSTTRDDYRGDRALQIISPAATPAYVIQDVPVASRGFVFEIAVRLVRGEQSIAFLSEWDRMDPGTAAALRIDLLVDGLHIHGKEDDWRVDTSITADAWHHLLFVSDPRSDQLTITVDGTLLASLPAVPAAAPQTLVIGGNPTRGISRARYDEARLLRLAELELSTLRRSALRNLPEAQRGYVMKRLDDAAWALSSGADRFAAPELRAAARTMARLRSDEDSDLQTVITATEALIDLVSAR
ncbi:MAG TPA: hypothetical protein QGG47_05760 [Acidobacteriota bacterium]|nr:hypothetical protein [Acidobacteriota bacterium]